MPDKNITLKTKENQYHHLTKKGFFKYFLHNLFFTLTRNK